MWAPVIVIREEPRQRVEPLAVGVVRALVGPLGLHDLVERLRLPVGLRPERSRALHPYIPGRRRAGEDAAYVAGAVVSQDALDGDVLALEVGKRSNKEGGSGRAAFVGQGLDVGVAGVVVHGHVEEVETEAGAALRATVGLAEAGQDALAAALRDAAELLDVQVDQVARAGMLVADDLACGAMEPREAVESGAAQDSVDGGAGNAQPPPDAVRPPGEYASSSADGHFLQLIGLAGAAQGTAGAVVERVQSTFTEPPHPLGDGSAGDAEQAGHFGLGPSGQHLFDQLGASHGGQSCITMGHEGPPVTAGVGFTQQQQRGLSPVNNLYGNYI